MATVVGTGLADVEFLVGPADKEWFAWQPDPDIEWTVGIVDNDWNVGNIDD